MRDSLTDLFACGRGNQREDLEFAQRDVRAEQFLSGDFHGMQ